MDSVPPKGTGSHPVVQTPLQLPPLTENEIAALPAPIVAREESSWSIRVGADWTAADPEIAELLRESSGLAWNRGDLVSVQSHAEFVEIVTPTRAAGVPVTLAHRRVALPKDPLNRTTVDLTLEAVVAAKDWKGDFLLAFGAGSTAETRRLVRMRVSGGDFDMAVVEARKFYSALIELPGFATSTLNVEGVAWIKTGASTAQSTLRICQRGNGKARGALTPTSATCEIRQDVLLGYLERCRRSPDAVLGPDLSGVRRYELGQIAGVALSFTEAAGLGERMLYVAAAERSMDAGIPGRLFGTAIGVIEADGSARYAKVLEADGSPTRSKISALAVSSEGEVIAVLQGSQREMPRMCKLEFSPGIL